MKPMPHTAAELVDELEAAYPPACMSEQDTVAGHQRYAGQVELIQALRRRLIWSEEEATATAILAKM